MRIVHVVVTDAFAGTERYVGEVSRRQAGRGHNVVVLGGSGEMMPREIGGARWHAARSLPEAVGQLLQRGRQDVVHAHLTAGELAASICQPTHRAMLVATRHIAAPRGKTRRGRLVAPLIARSIDIEVAISHFVAAALECPPHAVLHNGVAISDSPYDPSSRGVLVLQRLAPEKDTATAVHAWALSGLGELGWEMWIAGSGDLEADLKSLTRRLGLSSVRFLGQVQDAGELLSRSALLLAPAPGEPLGLSVLEAMARGVPTVVCAGGGHLESVPAAWQWTFPPGDVQAAARVLRAAAENDEQRVRASRVARQHAVKRFDIEQHVDDLLDLYRSRPAERLGPRA